jgi:competence protein ComEC
MGGIIDLHCPGDGWLWGARLMQITDAAICLVLELLVLFIWVCLRGRKIAVIEPFIFVLFFGAAGFNLAALQYNLHQLAYLTAPSEVKITAEIFNIDGWASDRSRLCVKIIETNSDRPQLASARVRVTSKTMPKAATIGAMIEMRVRLFPPPRRILPGTTDFGRNARVADIVAFGFVTSSIRVLAAPEKPNMPLLLGILRAAQAKYMNDALAKPAGGSTAALIASDRRFIVEPVYDLFRKSGLAHLLAISGLHVGLLRSGCMAAMRYGAGLLPVWASYLAIHKYAVVMVIVMGLIYVCLSGASVSAMRAFMMALLVILAVLIDRRALIMRKCALAGFVILALNPVALFSAGFQPSFSVTAILVMVVFVGYACTAPWRFAEWEMVGLACLIGSLKPLPDAVIFAQNRSPTLVAGSAGGELTIHRRLSAFLIDMAALSRGRHADSEKFITVMNFASINCGAVRRLALC